MRDNSAQIASGKQLVFNQGLPASIDLNAEQHIYFLESNTFTPLLGILMSSVFPDYTLDRWSYISLHNPKKKQILLQGKGVENTLMLENHLGHSVMNLNILYQY